MTRRQWLVLVTVAAAGARPARGGQKPENGSAPRTVTLSIEGMT